MLNALSRPVSSVALNTFTSAVDGFPTNTQMIQGMQELLSRAPGSGANAAPDVVSISAWWHNFDLNFGGVFSVDATQVALDWMTVKYASHSLIVFAAGNFGYEPPGIFDENHYGWCSPCSRLQGGDKREGGSSLSTSCFNGVDDDGDGLVDCDDKLDCGQHFACRYRHYIIPQIQNGLVVGSVNTASPGFTGPVPSLDESGHPLENQPGFGGSDAKATATHSSWRFIWTPHDDVRLPHVVANGVKPQYADNLAGTAGDTEPHWFRYEQTEAASGTSFATPQVAGYAAYAYRTAATLYPSDRMKALQATRAMVIASARHNVKTYYYPDWPAGNDNWPASYTQERSRLITGTPNSSYDQRRHRDGAGMIDGHALGKMLNGNWTWVPWVTTGTFDVPLSGSPPPQTKELGSWPTPQPGTTGRFRLALTWHPYAGDSAYAIAYPGYDLDVCLFNGATDQLVACANSWDNTYEFMDVDIKADGTSYYSQVYLWGGQPGTTVTYALSHYYDAFHGTAP